MHNEYMNIFNDLLLFLFFFFHFFPFWKCFKKHVQMGCIARNGPFAQVREVYLFHQNHPGLGLCFSEADAHTIWLPEQTKARIRPG